MINKIKWISLAFVEIFFVLWLFTVPVAAAVCATQTGLSTPNGNNVLSSYGDYGTPFTVAANCDVTDIKLTLGSLSGSGTFVGTIWDSTDNVLVTGSAVSITDVWPIQSLQDSVVAAGTYTLTTGNTYWVGFSDLNGSSNLKTTGFSGGTAINYYSAGWTAWVPSVNFEIDSLSSSPSPATTTVATTTSLIIYDNPTLDWFLGFMIFFLCMAFPIWLFKRK